MKTVFIADNHPVTRKGIMCMLKNNKKFAIIGKAGNAEDLYTSLRESTPDILVMEIDIPQINGINALRNIKTEFPKMRVLIFSTHPEEIYALRAIKSGAAGYVPKTATTKTFVKAMKHIAKGGIFLNEELTSTFTSRNVGESNAISRYKKLSSREIEVLNLRRFLISLKIKDLIDSPVENGSYSDRTVLETVKDYNTLHSILSEKLRRVV